MLYTFQDKFLSYGLSFLFANAASRFVVILIVVALSILANYIAKRFILKILHALFSRTDTKWDDTLFKERVFERLSHLAPALVVFACSSLIFPDAAMLEEFLARITLCYMVFVGALVVDAMLNAGLNIYQTYPIAKEHSIKAYVQVVKVVVYLLAAIIILAFLVNKSPWALISGLGALTAVLMLVFKDSILGFVASIQLAGNNMVRPNDWISMPQYGADGTVIDVTINTVKVQNWDKTISTIPTYALISNSFKNWRGMSESGGRRIKRAVNLDMNSVKFCTEEMLNRFEKIHVLADYIKQKRQELAEHNQKNDIDTQEVVNGRRLTNLGVFRAYAQAYLRDHPKIHNHMTFLVRHLEPTEYGIPIQIYVFSNDQAWANYESIQADIFDHLLAVIPEFDLRVFQNPTGFDFKDVAFSKH